MIKYSFVFVMFIHGLLHLVGFAKAFGYGRINQITSEITRASGVCWVSVSLLLVLSPILPVVRL